MHRRTLAAALATLGLAVFAPPLLYAAPQAASAAKPAAATSGEDASFDRDIRKMLELSGAAKLADQMIALVVQNFSQTTPDAPAGYWESFAKEVDTRELIEQIIPIYKQHLSHDDIRGAIAFYESPAGQHLVANQPAILQDSMAIGQQWGMQISQRALAKANALKAKEKKP